MFSGPVGVGKSHLAAAILYAIDRKADFVNVPTLMKRLRNTFNSDGASDSQILDGLMNVPVLVLDDLGAERVTGYSEDMLYLLINTRYSSRHPTIVTTNKDTVEGGEGAMLIDQIEARSFDRIMGLCWNGEFLEVYPMDGESCRWGSTAS